MNAGGDNILRKLNLVFVLSILILLGAGAAFATENSSNFIDNSNSDALDAELVSNNDASAKILNTYETNGDIRDNSDEQSSKDNTVTTDLNKDVYINSSKNLDEQSSTDNTVTTDLNKDVYINSSKNLDEQSSTDNTVTTDLNKDVGSVTSSKTENNNENKAAAGDTVTKKTSKTVTKKFTKSQIQTAAKTLKSYVESKHKLPSFVTIGKKRVTMSEALYLLSKFIVNTNSKIKGKITLIKLQDQTKVTYYKLKGKWYKSNGIKVANNIVSFMKSNKRAPNFVNTSLGTMKFKSAVYYMARSVVFYKSNNRLPKYVTVNDAVFTTSSQRFASLKDIEKAATELKTYVECNHALPSNIVINNKKVSMPELLYLLCKANVNNGLNVNSIKIINLPDQTLVIKNNLRGTWYKDNLINIANGILNFMDSNKRAPNTMSTELGTMQFRSLVYYMARSIKFYESNNRLPNYVTVDDSVFTQKTNNNINNINTNSQYIAYLKATNNCQVNSKAIKNLADSITFGVKDTYTKAKAIFNWVRDECNYSYYFNTKNGALTTLSTKAGNCCDLSHLVVAISRAAGIPTRYAHGTCVFRSGNVIGHVWAEILVNGQWLKADASSNYNNFNEINNWNSATIKGYYTELPF